MHCSLQLALRHKATWLLDIHACAVCVWFSGVAGDLQHSAEQHLHLMISFHTYTCFDFYSSCVRLNDGHCQELKGSSCTGMASTFANSATPASQAATPC